MYKTKEEFKAKINTYFNSNNPACIDIGKLPVTINGDNSFMLGGASNDDMTTLKKAGLLSEKTVTVKGDSCGGDSNEKNKIYTLTSKGEKYAVKDGKDVSLCYGKTSVYKITKIEKVSNFLTKGNSVNFTYNITNLAPWSQNKDIQDRFNQIGGEGIKSTIAGIKKR